MIGKVYDLESSSVSVFPHVREYDPDKDNSLSDILGTATLILRLVFNDTPATLEKLEDLAAF